MKIMFDIEEFKNFLGELDEVDYNHGCRSTIDVETISYYLDEKTGRIMIKRVCEMYNGTTEIDLDYDYFEHKIKGEII